jgi:hypothetical protein
MGGAMGGIGLAVLVGPPLGGALFWLGGKYFLSVSGDAVDLSVAQCSGGVEAASSGIGEIHLLQHRLAYFTVSAICLIQLVWQLWLSYDCACSSSSRSSSRRAGDNNNNNGRNGGGRRKTNLRDSLMHGSDGVMTLEQSREATLQWEADIDR